MLLKVYHILQLKMKWRHLATLQGCISLHILCYGDFSLEQSAPHHNALRLMQRKRYRILVKKIVVNGRQVYIQIHGHFFTAGKIETVSVCGLVCMRVPFGMCGSFI